MAGGKTFAKLFGKKILSSSVNFLLCSFAASFLLTESFCRRRYGSRGAGGEKRQTRPREQKQKEHSSDEIQIQLNTSKLFTYS